MQYAEIAFISQAFGLNSFTFTIPSVLEKRMQVGQIVEVPFRTSIKKGLVLSISNIEPKYKCRDILRPLTPQLLSEKQIEKAKDIAKKYHSPLSRVLSLFLPKKIWNSDGLPPAKVLLTLNKEPENIRGKKQKELLDYLKKNGTTNIRKLKEDFSMPIINTLLEKDYIKKEFKEKFTEKVFIPINKAELRIEQKTAMESILSNKKTLLFAPTGSGKSFLLRYLAGKIAQEGGQALLLSPEIALTMEMKRKASELFGEENVLIYHSALTERERAEAWWRIKNKEAKIILSSRVGLFLPFADLRLVAMEEEHDDSYKNDQNPRFHSRDILEMLETRTVFSSATPSFESFHNIKNLVEMKGKPSKTKVNIVDIKDEMLSKNFAPISRILEEKIAQNIKNKKKVLLFLNRRGFHSFVFCAECGQSAKCPHCRISLTHHKKDNKNFLLCHHCGRVFNGLNHCSECASPKLKYFGFGTQKVEQYISERFPDAKIIRADRDSLSKKGKREQMIDEFFNGDADIIIGTQIISKGFDTKNIGLVGILFADASLQIPDFRANEKTFSLLSQVIGRIRGEGEAIIQTFLPEHKIFSFLQNSDYQSFYEDEIAERKKFTLPPFVKLAKIIFKDIDKRKAFSEARKAHKKVQKALKGGDKAFVSTPLAPFQYGKYHTQLLIYSNNIEEILEKVSFSKGIIDLNPVNTV